MTEILFPEPCVLSAASAHRVLDRVARSIGTTADEFIADLHAGKYANVDTAQVAEMSCMAPFVEEPS